MGSAVTVGGGVLTFWASRTALFTMSWLGSYPLGAATFISTPSLTAPLMRPWHMLLPSPT
jgi:hypothetical protein